MEERTVNRSNFSTVKEEELARIREALKDPSMTTEGKYKMLLRLYTLGGRMDWLSDLVNDKDLGGWDSRKLIFEATVDDIVVQIVEGTRNSVPPALNALLDEEQRTDSQQRGQKVMLEAIIHRLKQFNDEVLSKVGDESFGTADCDRKAN